MTLLITIFAAIASTVIWYIKDSSNTNKVGTLALMYWGASIMWFTDALFEYAELHSQFFTPDIESMINDSYLGLSVVALGLIIWLVILLSKDPNGVLKRALSK